MSHQKHPKPPKTPKPPKPHRVMLSSLAVELSLSKLLEIQGMGNPLFCILCENTEFEREITQNRHSGLCVLCLYFGDKSVVVARVPLKVYIRFLSAQKHRPSA